MPVDTTIANARKELEAGKIWRAKEIVRSSLGNYGFSPELYELYGDILVAMDDKLQAGRYYFYSIDQPRMIHKEPLELFLARHGENGYKPLLAAAPRIELTTLQNLRLFARSALSERGAPEQLKKETQDRPEWIPLVGCLLALGTIAALALVGLVTVVKWLL